MDKNDPGMSIDGMHVQGRVLRRLMEGTPNFSLDWNISDGPSFRTVFVDRGSSGLRELYYANK